MPVDSRVRRTKHVVFGPLITCFAGQKFSQTTINSGVCSCVGCTADGETSLFVLEVRKWKLELVNKYWQLLDGDWSASLLAECLTVSYCWKNACIRIDISAHRRRFGSLKAFIRIACAEYMDITLYSYLIKYIKTLINYIVIPVCGMLQSVASMSGGGGICKIQGVYCTYGYRAGFTVNRLWGSFPKDAKSLGVLIHLLSRILRRHAWVAAIQLVYHRDNHVHLWVSIASNSSNVNDFELQSDQLHQHVPCNHISHNYNFIQ